MKNILNFLFNFKLSSKTQYSEEEYYEELFIKNEIWNKSTPNNDELKRWLVIERFIKEIHNNFDLKILDLGCGRGWLTNLVSQYGEVLGIEPVDKVVEYAKKLFPSLNFLKGSAKNLVESHIGFFDLIVSSEVIEHIPDAEKKQFTRAIHQLLTKNGFLILTTPRKDAQKQWNKYRASNQPIEEWILESELKLLFEENGFSAKEIERISMQPNSKAPSIPIYQVWLFQKI